MASTWQSDDWGSSKKGGIDADTWGSSKKDDLNSDNWASSAKGAVDANSWGPSTKNEAVVDKWAPSAAASGAHDWESSVPNNGNFDSAEATYEQSTHEKQGGCRK